MHKSRVKCIFLFGVFRIFKAYFSVHLEKCNYLIFNEILLLATCYMHKYSSFKDYCQSYIFFICAKGIFTANFKHTTCIIRT